MQRGFARLLIVSLALPLPAQIGAGPAVFPYVLVLVPLMVAWAVDRAGTDGPRAQRIDPVLVALVVYSTLLFVSTAATGADWRMWSLWTSATALFASARYRLPALLTPLEITRTLVAVVAGLTALAVVQVVTGRPIGALAQYFDRGVRAALVYGDTPTGVIFKRVQGTFFSVDLFAMFLAFVLAYFVAQSMSDSAPLRRVANVGVALSAGMIAFTFSRGVWVGCALCLTALLVHYGRRDYVRLNRVLRIGGFALVALVGVLALAPDAVFARFDPEQIDQSVGVREGANEVAIDVIEARWATGVGYLEFVPASESLGFNDVGNAIRPHNVFLQVLAEQGVFAAVAYTAIGVLLVVEAVRVIRASRLSVGARDARAQAARVIATVGLWVVFMFVYAQANEYSVVPALMFFTGIGLAPVPATVPAPPRAVSTRPVLVRA